MKFAACGIKEVRCRRWWPAYEIGIFRWRWVAVVACWMHFYMHRNCGETWIEIRE